MAEGPYLMGIDFGTGGRARRHLRPRGDAGGLPRPSSSRPSTRVRAGPSRTPTSGGRALVAAVNGAMEQSGVAREEIAGISVDATAATVLALDENDRPLRPAIMWMDVRASDQAERIADDRRPGPQVQRLRARLGRVGAPKALWIKEQGARDLARRAATSATAATGSSNRLTGEWTAPSTWRPPSTTTTATRAATRRACYEAVGVEDFLEKYPAGGARPGRRSSESLRTEVAEELGLQARHAGGRGRRRRLRRARSASAWSSRASWPSSPAPRTS